MRSRGMTPEGAPETARRRTTSEGHYQSGHEESVAHSGPGALNPDFTNALALQPGVVAQQVWDNHWKKHFTMDLENVLKTVYKGTMG